MTSVSYDKSYYRNAYYHNLSLPQRLILAEHNELATKSQDVHI